MNALADLLDAFHSARRPFRLAFYATLLVVGMLGLGEAAAFVGAHA